MVAGERGEGGRGSEGSSSGALGTPRSVQGLLCLGDPPLPSEAEGAPTLSKRPVPGTPWEGLPGVGGRETAPLRKGRGGPSGRVEHVKGAAQKSHLRTQRVGLNLQR